MQLRAKLSASRVIAGVICAALALSCLGCDGEAGSGTDAGVEAGACAPGLEAHGTACVPIFDKCKENEVHKLGGGCERVGVEECPGGIKGPPDWTCKPIGAPSTCLPGWSKVTGGWCEPIRPTASCAKGELPVIGSTTCQPIEDCGSGTWGKITTSGATVFVDASYTGSDSDGSQTKPYTTITDALAAAPSGAQIAVAAGTYNENVQIKSPLTLQGRCPQMVTIQGQSSSTAAAVGVTADGVELRGLTATGPAGGVLVTGAKVTLKRMAIQDSDYTGVTVGAGAVLEMEDSLVTNNRKDGLHVSGASAVLTRVAITKGQPRASDNKYGYGLYVSRTSQPAKVAVKDCLVLDNRTAGVILFGADAEIDGTLIHGTQSKAVTKEFGTGIDAMLDDGVSSNLTMRDSVVAENRMAGVRLFGSTATLERVVIRDTREEEAGGLGGDGIYTWYDQVPSTLVLRDAVVIRNRLQGVAVIDTTATIERTVVSDTKEAPDGAVGIYVSSVDATAEMKLTDSLVANNAGWGISLSSAKATVARTVVRDTQPIEWELANLSVGVGIGLKGSEKLPSTLTLTDGLVTKNRGFGMFIEGSTANLDRTVISHTLPEAQTSLLGDGVVSDEGSVLIVRDSALSSNARGMHFQDTKATLERVVVRDTAASGEDGVGVYSIYDKGPSELTMRDSVVRGSRVTGISLGSSTGDIERTVVGETRSTAEGKYGDGIQVVSLPARPRATLTLADSLVSTSARAGLVFVDAGGVVSSSVFRSGVFAIDLEEGGEGGSNPTIASDNVYEDNKRNSVTFGQGLAPAPVPELPDFGLP